MEEQLSSLRWLRGHGVNNLPSVAVPRVPVWVSGVRDPLLPLSPLHLLVVLVSVCSACRLGHAPHATVAAPLRVFRPPWDAVPAPLPVLFSVHVSPSLVLSGAVLLLLAVVPRVLS